MASNLLMVAVVIIAYVLCNKVSNKAVNDILLPPDSLIVLIILIKRGKDAIIPKGDTVLLEEDVLVITDERLQRISQ